MLLETGLYILVAESCQKFLKLSDLTELEEFDLPDNYLEELPTSINKLKNLKRLISEVNQWRELPQAIAELSNLTVLSVNNNQLSVLPSNIKHLKNLRGLYSSSNQSTTLPDEIGELKELEWLNERMETGDCSSKYENQSTTLPDEIGELKKLKVLLVAGNHFVSTNACKYKVLVLLCDVATNQNIHVQQQFIEQSFLWLITMKSIFYQSLQFYCLAILCCFLH